MIAAVTTAALVVSASPSIAAAARPDNRGKSRTAQVDKQRTSPWKALELVVETIPTLGRPESQVLADLWTLPAIEDELRSFAEALGVAVGKNVDHRDVLNVADALSVEVGAPVTPGDLERLRVAYAQRTAGAVARVGRSFKGAVTIDDVRATAFVLGLELGDVVNVRDIDLVVETAQEWLPPQVRNAALEVLVAADIDPGQVVQSHEVIAAARELGVRLEAPIDLDDIETVRVAVFNGLAPIMDEIGLAYGRAVHEDDVRALARRIGADVGSTVNLAEVDRLQELAVRYVSPQVAAAATEMLEFLDIDHGSVVNDFEIRRAAHELTGAHLEGLITEADIRRVHQAYLQELRPAFNGMDLDYGADVDDDDVRRLAATVGADIGSAVNLEEVDRLLRLVAAHRGGPTPRFAVMAGVNIRLPSRAVKLVGFHESSNGLAFGMRPTAKRATTVLPSRGRGSGRTSAVDVAVVPNTTVLSPVRGTIVETSRYRLYGKYPDEKIRIRPDGNPDALVTVLHITGTTVRTGQRVEAGDPIARRATRFPFHSQIDGWAGSGPHVHIEARRG